MFPWSIYSVKLTFVSVNEFRCTGLRTKYLSCVFSKNTESTFSTSHGRHQVRGWCPDLWMVPKCHAVPCNVQEDLGSTLLDGYQSGECEYRHFLAFHYTTYVISVLTVSEPKGFKLDARQQRELGGHPGFLQLRTRAGTTREISTATSRALRLQSHVRARASASGKESAKKKKKAKVTGKAQQARERSSRARRRATERREPSSGRGSRAAARDPLKAGGDRPVAPHPHQGRKPRRRPHESRPRPHAAPPPRRAHFLSGQIQSPSLTRKFLVDILDASSTAARSDVPHRSRGASRRGCPRAAGPALRCWEWGDEGQTTKATRAASLPPPWRNDARDPAARPEALPRGGLTAFLSRRWEDSPAWWPSPRRGRGGVSRRLKGPRSGALPLPGRG